MKPVQGFTLVEAAVTVAVTAIIATIAVPSYKYYIGQAQVNESNNAATMRALAVGQNLKRGQCTEVAGVNDVFKNRYGTLTISGTKVNSTGENCPSGCKATFVFNNTTDKAVQGKQITYDILNNLKLSLASTNLDSRYLSKGIGKVSKTATDNCTAVSANALTPTTGGTSGSTSSTTGTPSTSGEVTDTTKPTTPTAPTTPTTPTNPTPPSGGTGTPPSGGTGTPPSDGTGTPSGGSQTINQSHVSGFVRILNSSPASPSFEMLEFRTLPVVFQSATYWINSNDDLGYVIDSRSVKDTFQKSDNTMLVIMESWQSKQLYGYYGNLDKNNTRYFIPMSDGRVLANISNILVDKKWSTNGKLRFASDGSIGVTFGYTNKAFYDSGVGGLIPVPFTGVPVSIYKK